VAYRPVARRWLCKQRPLLGNAHNIHARNIKTRMLCNPFLNNGSVNTPPQQYGYCWKRGFLLGPCKMAIKIIGAISSVELCKGGWEEMAIRFSWELKVRLWRKELVEWLRLWKENFMCYYSNTVIIIVLKSVARVRLWRLRRLSVC
jgi:hypothetical protein